MIFSFDINSYVTMSNYFFIHIFEGKLVKTFNAAFFCTRQRLFGNLLPQNEPLDLKIEFCL